MELKKITSQELLENLSKEDGINLRYLTKDDFGHNTFTTLPLLHNSNVEGLLFYDNIADEEIDRWNVDEYLEVHGLELEEMTMYKIFEYKELMKITPSEILDIINQEIAQTNLEEGLRQPLCKCVTMDNEGVYCWDVVPQFEKDFDLFKMGCFGYEGLQFNTKGYEVVGLNHGQMFVDYLI